MEKFFFILVFLNKILFNKKNIINFKKNLSRQIARTILDEIDRGIF